MKPGTAVQENIQILVWTQYQVQLGTQKGRLRVARSMWQIINRNSVPIQRVI